MRRLFVLLLALAGPLWAAPVAGKCVAVTDGDTLKILLDGKAVAVRLNGIDAPEKKQAFGPASKAALSALAFGKTLQIYPTARDRYGRLLAWCFCGKIGLNGEQVKTGFAWWYRLYEPKNTNLATWEQSARDAKRGLWADENPVAPWEWRRSRRQASRPNFQN